MFRPLCVAALIVAAVLGTHAMATARERGKADDKKPISNSIGMKLTLIPPGQFMMGASESAEEMAAFFNKTYGAGYMRVIDCEDSHPQHRVRITRPFYLGTYHVTRGQFRQFVAATGYKTDAEKDPRHTVGYNAEKNDFEFGQKYSWRDVGFGQTDEHPVVNVSWNDATAFCNWLSTKEGKTYRLPTEAEWEYACRAGTTTRYYSGDDPETLAQVGNVADAAMKAAFPQYRGTFLKSNDRYVFTSRVGMFRPNAFGLFDMHGNAQQWCADRYDESPDGPWYYRESPVDDPQGPESGAGRVLRGGSYFDGPKDVCASYRYGRIPDMTFWYVGFRVALSR